VANLALFDFDGTITTADTFTAFVRQAVTPRRMALGKIALSPLIAAYKVGVLPATILRESIVTFGFRGTRADEVRRLGSLHAQQYLPSVVRPDALERIAWHKAQGDVVVVVSASLDVYLGEWCTQHGLELICTELEVRDGVVTGRYRNGDCTGHEKARRVRERYDVGAFPVVYAYGDTPEDDQLLALATKRFYRWRDVSA
jgi:HAD superfamily hydrolase (TIGR01490 family)